MLITRENLTIRNAVETDAPQLGIWWRDGELMALVGFPNGLPITDEKIAADLAACSDDTFRLLIMEVDLLPVGEMNYKNLGNAVAEIGIKICDAAMCNRGYGPLFLRMLIDSLFENYAYEKIVLDTNIKNLRAQCAY